MSLLRYHLLLGIALSVYAAHAQEPNEKSAGAPANRSDQQSSASPTPARQTPEASSVAQSLIDMERQWAQVCVTHDTSVLQRILADDFLGTKPDGKLYTKSEDIEIVAKSRNKFLSGSVDNVKVRFFGDDVAVLYGLETCIKSLADGKQEREVNIWTDTWVKRDGRWQIVAAHDMRQPSESSAKLGQ